MCLETEVTTAIHYLVILFSSKRTTAHQATCQPDMLLQGIRLPVRQLVNFRQMTDSAFVLHSRKRGAFRPHNYDHTWMIVYYMTLFPRSFLAKDLFLKILAFLHNKTWIITGSGSHQAFQNRDANGLPPGDTVKYIEKKWY